MCGLPGHIYDEPGFVLWKTGCDTTGGALSQQSSTSINAPLEEEEHPRC
jgi:hypothetical protein